MIRSMTGFGQADKLAGGIRLSVAVRSVNHRYGELTFRMPREWLLYEDGLRKLVTARVKRGRTELFVSAEYEGGAGETPPVEIDWSAADGYVAAAGELRRRFGFADDLSLKDMLALPGLVAGRRGLPTGDETERLLGEAVTEAVDALVRMREVEGAHLAADLRERLAVIADLRGRAGLLAAEASQQYEARLRQRVAELLGERAAAVDETRLVTEVALMAEKSDIHEELARLDSHLQQFADMLELGEPVGRKLDFIAQEMNREINTIGSKTSHVALTGIVVELKAELEKVREQAQNIE